MPWNAGVYGTHARRAPSARNTGGGNGGVGTRDADVDDKVADVDAETDDDDASRCLRRLSSPSAFPECAWLTLYAGNPGSQNCTGGSGGAGGTMASAGAPPSPRASDAIVSVGVSCGPRGMTGIGSGDAAREELPLEDKADPAPPCMRNGTQERFGAITGVGFGAGTGSGGVSRR